MYTTISGLWIMAIYSVIVRNTVCEIGHLIKKQSAQDCEFKVVPTCTLKWQSDKNHIQMRKHVALKFEYAV